VTISPLAKHLLRVYLLRALVADSWRFLSIIDDAIWMKIYIKKTMSSLLLSHHLLVKCITNIYNYNFFHIGFEIIFYNYSQLCNCLEHLLIDFLLAKEKIPHNHISHKANPFF